MRVVTATEPASPKRANEDFVSASHNTVVLLDGAGNPPGADEGCHHGVAWYARHLGTAVLNRATDSDQPLAAALAQAIDDVAWLHRDTCNLDHPGSPSATVVALRQRCTQLDYLVLADSTLVLDEGGEVTVVSDHREAEIGRRFRQAMDAQPSDSPKHTAELRRYIEAMRAHRNQPGGFWVASADPAVARQALTGAIPSDTIKCAVLLSDGASRLVDRFALSTWPDLVRTVATSGPGTLVDQVRQAEKSDPIGVRWPRGKSTDDASVAYVVPTA